MNLKLNVNDSDLAVKNEARLLIKRSKIIALINHFF